MWTSLHLALLLGCAPPPYTPPDTGSTDPSIAFTWPLPETELTGCVVATVNVQNFSLVDFRTHPDPVEGEGHWHVEHPAGPDTYDVCDKPWCVAHFELLENGPVNDYLRANLVGNDHQQLYDANQQPVTAAMAATFLGGECAEALGTEAYEDTGDTGGWDTGDTGDGGS